MLQYVYIVMHDKGWELVNDWMGNIIGVFSDDMEAKMWLLEHGFSQQDTMGNYWNDIDRAWIIETSVDNPPDDDII